MEFTSFQACDFDEAHKWWGAYSGQDIDPPTDSVGTFLRFPSDMCPFEDRLIQQTSPSSPHCKYPSFAILDHILINRFFLLNFHMKHSPNWSYRTNHFLLSLFGCYKLNREWSSLSAPTKSDARPFQASTCIMSLIAAPRWYFMGFWEQDGMVDIIDVGRDNTDCKWYIIYT